MAATRHDVGSSSSECTTLNLYFGSSAHPRPTHMLGNIKNYKNEFIHDLTWSYFIQPNICSPAVWTPATQHPLVSTPVVNYRLAPSGGPHLPTSARQSLWSGHPESRYSQRAGLTGGTRSEASGVPVESPCSVSQSGQSQSGSLSATESSGRRD